ncbi:hypothetical protein KOEU_03360 [Komagataeibacter europaeus]|uniref:Uncharacterized protein n=2 Tax=Komagataeibacter europaeus TaxID=33995 RepID=A0A0M0EMA5_KOMEU|nr:hypothetical protein KOEU_03360 [Komagataeibacter europaeus]
MESMDFDMSYYKFHGVDRAALLDALGLCDTGEPDPDDEAPYAIADLPNGWFVIRTNNDSGLISDYDRKTLCREGRLVTCDVATVDPVSRAAGYANGEEIWTVQHDGRNNDHLDLDIEGDAPDALPDLHKKAFAAVEQGLVDPRGPGSMLDVPLELVRAVTGFRHDRPQDVRPTPVFTWLAPIKRSLT